MCNVCVGAELQTTMDLATLDLDKMTTDAQTLIEAMGMMRELLSAQMMAAPESSAMFIVMDNLLDELIADLNQFIVTKQVTPRLMLVYSMSIAHALPSGF